MSGLLIPRNSLTVDNQGRFVIQTPSAPNDMRRRWPNLPFIAPFDGNVLNRADGTAATNAGIIYDTGRWGRAAYVDEALTNLLNNPRFEGTYSGGAAPLWSESNPGGLVGNAVAEETAIILSGSSAQRITTTSLGSGLRYGVVSSVTTSGGTSSSVGVWVYVASYSPDACIRLRLDNFSGAGLAYAQSQTMLTDDMVGQWTRVNLLDGSHTATSGAGQLFVWVEDNNADIVLDNAIWCEGVAYAIPWFSGDDDGATWAGSPDGSQSNKAAGEINWPSAGYINESAGTVSCWVYPLDLGIGASPTIVDDNGLISELMIDTAGNTLECELNGTSIDTPSGTVTQNQWHHIALTWNGTTGQLYLDGVAGNATNYTTAAPGGTLYVGSDGTPSNRLQGLIDELLFFDAELNASDITALYTATLPAQGRGEHPAPYLTIRGLYE